MRLCVIGNSHLASLKLAIREGLFRLDGLDLVFWGVPGTWTRGETVTYENGRLCTPHRDVVLGVSEQRYAELPIGTFDALVFHGVPLDMYVFNYFRSHSDNLCEYSRAQLRDLLQFHMEQEAAYHLLKALRTDYDRPVLVSPIPLRAESGGEWRDAVVAAEELEHLDACVEDVLTAIPVTYLPQPRDTIRDHKYTKNEFSINSVRLTTDLETKHPADDHYHMNSRYGARVLEEIVARLAALVG